MNGTLQLGNGGTSGSIVGDVSDDGRLVFDRADTLSFGGTIFGTGSVAQIGTGTTVLTADHTYSGGTTISAGTLQLGTGGTTGSILGDVLDNGQFTIDRSDTVTFAGLVSGTGSLAQIGPGTTVLTANNTYAGGTTISAGTLQLGDGGTSGSIVGNVLDNGVLAFDRSDTVTFPGIISGTGSLAHIGTGTTVLTADNTYSGGTTISAGALHLGNGGTSGSVMGNVLDNGVLAFDRSDTVTFGGVISGAGAVAQIRSGTTILTADDPYSGGTAVLAGTLAVGDPAHSGAALSGGGPVDVVAGATLGGYGSVAGMVANQGTVAVADALPVFAGSANGTFTVDGTLDNGGLLQIGGQGVGNRLVVIGNLVGRPGSTAAINTVLGADGSPSDRIVIDGGAASGQTSLFVTNRGDTARAPQATAFLSSKR